MLAICAYYAGIMLNAFATYYAHNYAGIIGSSLPMMPVHGMPKQQKKLFS